MGRQKNAPSLRHFLLYLAGMRDDATRAHFVTMQRSSGVRCVGTLSPCPASAPVFIGPRGAKGLKLTG